MKNYFYLLFIFLISNTVSLKAYSQKKVENGDIAVDRQIKGEIIFGGNLSQVDGDEVYGFKKFGVNAGFGGILPLGHRFSMSVEVLFNQKGSYQKLPPSPDSLSHVPYYSLRLNYLTAPIMFHFEDRNTWTFGVGFSWGRLVGFKEIEHNKSQPWERADTIPYKTKNDFSVIADIRFRVWKHLKIDVQYSYSMAKIRTRAFNPNPGIVEPWTRNQYNNLITVRLLYYLNEKYLPERFTFKRNKNKKKKEKN